MAALLLTACGGGGIKRQSNVWDLYDVRHPVPAGSAVPVSRAASPYYNPQPPAVYRDNDAAYVPPVGYPTYNSTVCESEVGIGCD
ncbi:MAG: hypothetical protein MRY32_01720 [Rickettsiales bacterium]|nr:hypothetical protein [Rickettsiales bacterium]